MDSRSINTLLRILKGYLKSGAKDLKFIFSDVRHIYKIPKKLIPKFVVWLLAPAIGFTRKYAANNVGLPIEADNNRSIRDLSLEYHTLEKLSVLNQVKHSNYMTGEIRESSLSLSKFAIEYFYKGIELKLFEPMPTEIAIALYFSLFLHITGSIIEKRMENTVENLNLLYISTMAAFKNTGV